MKTFDVYAMFAGKFTHWHVIADGADEVRELVRNELGLHFKGAILVRIK